MSIEHNVIFEIALSVKKMEDKKKLRFADDEPQLAANGIEQQKKVTKFFSSCSTYLCTGKSTRLGRRSVVWASLKPIKRELYRTQQRMYQNGYKTKNVANIQIYWLVFELLKLIKGFTYKKALKSVDVRKVQSFCVLLKILW